RLAAAEARRPFDLARGPLLRATLLDLGAGERRLAVTMHHIVSDGWSVGILVREATSLYAAALAGRRSPPADLTIPYAHLPPRAAAPGAGARGAGAGARPRAGAPGGPGRPARAAARPAAPAGAALPRRVARAPSARGGRRGARAGVRGDALHGPPRRLPGAPP